MRSSSGTRDGQGGFTFLEVTLSTAILAIGFLALWGTLIYCQRSNEAAEQKKKAIDAASARIEFLKSQPFDTLLARFGPGSGADANRFDVPSLDSDIGRAHGRMLLYFDETNPTHEEGIGLPRDLNGDGDATDRDVSSDFRILPVRVRVTWNGALGEQEIELRTLLRRED
jgi:hypothetical protein